MFIFFIFLLLTLKEQQRLGLGSGMTGIGGGDPSSAPSEGGGMDFTPNITECKSTIFYFSQDQISKKTVNLSFLSFSLRASVYLFLFYYLPMIINIYSFVY